MKLKDLIKETMGGELYNPQSDDATFKKGILVKDINPNCPHHNSMGAVTKVSGKEVTYEVENVGRTYQPGDILTKTKEQLIPLNAENIKSLSETKSKLKKMIKKELLKEGIPGLVASIDASQQTIWTEIDNISQWSMGLESDRKIKKLVLIMERKRDELTKAMSNLLKAVKQSD